MEMPIHDMNRTPVSRPATWCCATSLTCVAWLVKGGAVSWWESWYGSKHSTVSWSNSNWIVMPLERCWTCFFLKDVVMLLSTKKSRGSHSTETSWQFSSNKMSPLGFSCDHQDQAPGDATHQHDFCFSSCWNFGNLALQCRGADFFLRAGNPARQNCQIDSCCFMKMFFAVVTWSLQWLREIHWNPGQLCVSCPGHWRADQTDLGVRVSCWGLALCAHFLARIGSTSCAACSWYELYTADSNHKGSICSIWLNVYILLQWCRVILQAVWLQHAFAVVYWTEPAPACFFDIQSNWGKKTFVPKRQCTSECFCQVSVKSTCFLKNLVYQYILDVLPPPSTTWPFQYYEPILSDKKSQPNPHLPLARWGRLLTTQADEWRWHHGYESQGFTHWYLGWKENVRNVIRHATWYLIHDKKQFLFICVTLIKQINIRSHNSIRVYNIIVVYYFVYVCSIYWNITYN